jgi:hypothetical protein
MTVLPKTSSNLPDPTLYLINEAPRHENIWGCEVIAPLSLTSSLDGGDLAVSRPSRLTPGEIDKLHSW